MRAHFMSQPKMHACVATCKKIRERKAQEKAKQSSVCAGTETEDGTGTSHIAILEDFLQESNADNDESNRDSNDGILSLT